MEKEKVIFQQEADDHCLTVYENRRLRWLTFDDDFIQTIIDKRKPWTPKLTYLKALCATTPKNASKLLVLGLGGGAIIHYLKQRHPFLHVDAVEIDPNVINIAKSYFAIDIPIICDCALNYLSHAPAYSNIYIDVFTRSHTSDMTFIKNLLEKCHKADRISLNLLFDNIHDSYTFINEFRETFNQKTLCILTKGKNNLVMHAFLSGDYMESLTHLYRSQVIKKPRWNEKLGTFSELYR